MARIELVLFDLGGVLIDFGGIVRMRDLAGMASDEEVWERWLACRWVRSFERGGCTAEEFAGGVVADWSLPIDPPAFLAEFGGWVGDALPGADRLVADVRRSVPVGCLSNTNSVHWLERERWPFLDAFDHRFLSFEMGAVKPDPDLFAAVAERLEPAPGSVLFLDDNQVNVDGARAAGFRAERACGPAEARQVVVALGVL